MAFIGLLNFIMGLILCFFTLLCFLCFFTLRLVFVFFFSILILVRLRIFSPTTAASTLTPTFTVGCRRALC